MELILLLALPILAVGYGMNLFGGGSDTEDDNTASGSGNDSISGTSGNDILDGNGGNDTLRGLDGNDTLRGGDGADYIDGGKGNDLIKGGTGGDQIAGGQGNDKIEAGKGNDTVVGGRGNDLVYLGDGDDYSGFRTNETLDDPQFNQSGNDTIHGGAGKDYIDDYQGSNTLYGGAGTDQLISVDSKIIGDVQQSDKVYGGEGNDLLVGDYGDTLVGGAGQDTMRAFAQVKDNVATTIEGYNAAQDALQITVDPGQANATEWKLASTTNSQTGDVSVFLQNIATPSSVIDLALLKNPTGFQLSQIKLQYDSNPLA